VCERVSSLPTMYEGNHQEVKAAKEPDLRKIT